MSWMQFVGIHFNSCIDIVEIPTTAVRRRSEAAQLCGYEIKVGGMHARTKIGRRGFGGKSREAVFLQYIIIVAWLSAGV